MNHKKFTSPRIKRLHYLTIILGLICLSLFTFPNPGLAGIGDGLTDEEKTAMFKALKKLNVRLSELETRDLKNLQESQSLLLNKLQELQGAMPSIQGTLEQNKADINSTLSFLREQIHNILLEVEKNKQRLNALKDAVAADMESFSQKNQAALDKIDKTLEGQNQSIANTNTLLKDELGPAIAQQNRNILNTLIAKLDQFEQLFTENSRNNQKTYLDELAKVETKTVGVGEILRKNMEGRNKNDQKVDLRFENMLVHLNTLNENINKANQTLNGNLNKAHQNETNDLKDLQVRLDSFSKTQATFNANLDIDQKAIRADINRIKKKDLEAAKILDGKINTLGDALKADAQQVLKVYKNTDLVVAKIDTTRAETRLMDKKLSTLIDFLKKLVTAQGNVNQAIQGQSEAVNKLKTLVATQDKIDQALQGQTQIATMLQAVSKNQKQLDQVVAYQTKVSDFLEKVLASQSKVGETVNGSQNSVNQAVKNQVAIGDALADLRRKANVNISRNDDIKKMLNQIIGKSKSQN